jgi:hypothetical protein
MDQEEWLLVKKVFKDDLKPGLAVVAAAVSK